MKSSRDLQQVENLRLLLRKVFGLSLPVKDVSTENAAKLTRDAFESGTRTVIEAAFSPHSDERESTSFTK